METEKRKIYLQKELRRKRLWGFFNGFVVILLGIAALTFTSGTLYMFWRLFWALIHFLEK